MFSFLRCVMLLVVFGLTDSVEANVYKVTGQTTPSSFSRCQVENISSVVLGCDSPTQALHIIHFELGYRLDCESNTDSDCKYTADGYEDSIGYCEGRETSCAMYTANQSNCDKINNVNVTFQCVPAAATHSMCPERGLTKQNILGPVYLTTPDFLLPNPQSVYTIDTRCACELSPTPGSRVHVEPLYVDLEFDESCGFDWIGIISSAERHCGKEGTLTGSKSASFGGTRTLEFMSDDSQVERGAWFKVSTDAGSTFNLSCVTLSIDVTDYSYSEEITTSVTTPTTSKPAKQLLTTSTVASVSSGVPPVSNAYPSSISEQENTGIIGASVSSGVPPVSNAYSSSISEQENTGIIVGATVGSGAVLVIVVVVVVVFYHTRLHHSQSGEYIEAQQKDDAMVMQNALVDTDGKARDCHSTRNTGQNESKFTNGIPMYGLPKNTDHGLAGGRTGINEECYTVDSQTSLTSSLYRSLV